MKRTLLCMLAALLISQFSFADPGDDSTEIILAKQLKFMDSVESKLQWQHGTVALPGGISRLNLPADFKFLNAAQSKYIIHDIWGNPAREDVLGMIFPAESSPFDDSSFAFVLSFEETGFVKDDDADKIDYNEMFTSMRKEEVEVNKNRTTQGYDPIHLVSWAQSPFYDKDRKVLHWAKELQFGTDTDHTLNYDVRVLGRKGILSMNAIARMDNLPMVKANINKVLAIPEFTEGNRYSDFNSNTDKVAEYGIGALVAGGVLAKTGVLGLIGKFLVAAWKFIVLGVVAATAAVKKFFKRDKRDGAEFS